MRLVGAGTRVLATPCCGTPETLLGALAARSEEVDGITLSGGLLLGSHPYIPAIEAGRLRLRTWHVTAAVRKLVRSGQVDYVPARASDVPVFLRGAVDALLVRVSPPNGAGFCSLGPSASYTRVAMAEA